MGGNVFASGFEKIKIRMRKEATTTTAEKKGSMNVKICHVFSNKLIESF